MKPIRPTLRSLAREAGVSAMTFSLALRNRPEIPPATRARLQKIARQRGYQPDPVISKLMQHLRMRGPVRSQANICGLVRPGTHKHEFTDRVQVGLKQRAESLGFAFGRIELPADASRSQLQRVLRSRGVEGLILLPMPSQSDLGELLDWEQFSVVSVTSSVVAPRFHTVTPNHYDNMLRACQRLAKDGYRRIGLAISHEWDERVRHRWAGAVAWQNEFGSTAPIPPFIGTAVGPNLADPEFVDWVRTHQPDVVLVEAIDESLLARALKDVLLRKRPTIVTMDWPNVQAAVGIDQRPEVIGSVAIEILAGMIARGERGFPADPLNIMVDGGWASQLKC